MSGPMQMYVYIHDAILREVADVEVQARELNRDDPEAITAMADRLAWFHKMVKRHEDAEEQILFPAMNSRHEFIAEAYEFDHEDFEEHVFMGLNAAFAGLGRANGKGERIEYGRQLWRESVALHEHMRLHISKENELLLPKLQSEFDVSEQVEIAGGMAGMFDPPLLMETVGFTYGWQTAPDREGMIRFLQSILPPEAFGGITKMLAGRDAKAWAEMERRIPDLAGDGGG